MVISSFYQHCRCEKIAAMQNLIYEESRYFAFNKGVQLAVANLRAGVGYETILSQLHEYLKGEYSKLEQSFSWQAKVDAVNDTKRFKRFLEWFAESGMILKKGVVCATLETKSLLPDGSKELVQMVPMICTKEVGEKLQTYAFIIHVGASKKGMKGRSVHTNIVTDLYPLAAKLSLERTYPGINICVVYLSHESDTSREILPEFMISETASSNLYEIDYAGYYRNGVLDNAALMDIVESIISEKTAAKCSDCDYYSLCKSKPLTGEQEDAAEEVANEEASYHVPDFTEDQMKAVRHLNGPLRVCAGPGSGKTATLIGRIRYLVEEVGVNPAFLLVVTFTNEAAGELKRRCLSFLPEENLPCISTLNAFCYRLLRDNADLLDRDLKLLSDSMRLKIIKNIASVFPPLKGFKHGQLEGKNGLYQTISNRMDYLFSLDRETDIFAKYPDLGNDFLEFARQFKEIVELNGYITFDEQITLTNKMFAEHPDVLAIYQSVYKHIMVDEFQDVNQAQVDMLYSLADKHHNIVIVGDDDQGIYSFRGGKVQFMLDFPKVFPEAKTVVLRDNFRSTETLVEASKALIRNNRDRIEKEIRSGKKKGEVEKEPILVRSLEPGVIDSLVQGLIAEGYRYEDIAILSSKNAALENLHSELTSPTVLAKSYLRLDGLFLLISSVMALYKNLSDDRAFFQYMKLFGMESYLAKTRGLSLYESMISSMGIDDIREVTDGVADISSYPYSEPILALHGTYFSLLESAVTPSAFVRSMTLSIDWKSTNSADVMCTAIEQQQIRKMEDFAGYLDNIITFEENTRVDSVRGNRCLLSTGHDSKGKEFKVVLLYNDFSKLSEEVRRLFYVAMTRAKEQLFILQNDKVATDFLQEIPHKEMELGRAV